MNLAKNHVILEANPSSEENQAQVYTFIVALYKTMKAHIHDLQK